MTNSELERCIQEYGTDIYSFCRNLTYNQQEADDLYQDTFLKAVELCERIHMEENPKSYLLSVAVRVWKNKKRKYAWRKRIADTQTFLEEQGMEQLQEIEASQGASEMQKSPEEQILSRERDRLVREAVSHLPKRLRIPVLLYYMEELTIAQIASVLKIPEGTVKSRLYQARKRLEKELEDVLDEKRHG